MCKKPEIKISVRNLVEFIFRTGNLDSRFTGMSRAVEGTRIHRKIQQSSKEDYTPEVSLKHSVEFDDFTLTIEGRADGIIKDNDKYIIDEIKSTTAHLDLIDSDFNILHWAQAKCYAFIFSKEKDLKEIDIRLTYCHLETEELKLLSNTFTIEQLEKFFCDLTEKYFVWAKLTYDWNTLRNKSIKEMNFPFKAYRTGQRELAVAVYKTITNEKKLFCNAPTGIGKTISTLFPSIKAVAEGHTSKIFYLTAKTITRSVAEEAFEKMRAQGLKFKTVTLTAKDKICFKEKPSCTPELCEYAEGHFDRVNNAIFHMLKEEPDLRRDIIEKYGKEYKVCPFQLSLDLTLWADAVICDYNYAFDPSVYLKSFFSEKGGDYTLLVDEAHNLVDRSREMFSAELYKKPFLKLKKDMKSVDLNISKALGKINSLMIELRKLCLEDNYYITKEGNKDLYALLKKFIAQCEEYLTKNEKTETYEELLQLYFDAISFTRIWELYDNRYITYLEDTKENFKIKLFCLDPSHLLSEALKKAKAAVFFSATLVPMPYYKEILGGSLEDYSMHLKSPFDITNRNILIADRISTKYTHREKSYSEIINCIETVVSEKIGNYLIFFPSYSYMNAVYDMLIEKNLDIDIHIQEPTMIEEKREAFLNLFKPNPEKTTLGFCVLGGIFSEGIDLKQDRLIGAIIVSVGLPQICLERNIIRDYFQEKNNKGYEYAYMFPGMNKVLQAAGRVIRTEEDKGIILLIDQRFTSQSYLKLFPEEWFPFNTVNKQKLNTYINEFWKSF